MTNYRKMLPQQCPHCPKRFHFAITGQADAQEEVFLVEWFQDMIAEYNKRSGSPINSFHVLVREGNNE